MNTYQITITMTDVTEVNASSEEEAYQLAQEVFSRPRAVTMTLIQMPN